jgi:tetrahydromethanopterin:alpha-L-glutamate ligase
MGGERSERKVTDLRFAVLTAFPEEDWHSQRILAALALLGEARPVDPAEISARLGEDGALAVRAAEEAVDDFDAFVLVRALSPRGDADVQFSVYRALEEAGALVINRLGALLDAQDKFRTSQLLLRAGVATPAAALVQTPAEAAAVARSWGDVVLKPLAGSLGEGVERLPRGPVGEARAAQRVREEGALYVQRWVPNSGRDVRVLVVGGRAAGAVERVAAPGEFRTNIARGARPRAAELAPATARAAERSTWALGLDYGGVDLFETPAGPQVIEVNGTPAFDMILEATGCDMAQAIARHVAARASERHGQAPGPLTINTAAPRAGAAGSL